MIINEIIEKIKTLVEECEDRGGENDRIRDRIKEIFQPILEGFEELIASNEDKKYFLGRVIKIFTILLTKRCSSISKLKLIIKRSAQIPIKLWTE